MSKQNGIMAKEKVWKNVYDIIRLKIKKHVYKPEQLLSETDLANELGVSRTPITMALNVLEQEGLITNTNGKKTISRISPEEIIHLFDAKISLHCTIVRLAIERKTPFQESALKKIINDIRHFLESDFKHDGINPDLSRTWENLDERFHITLAEMAESPYITKLIDNIDIRWTRIRSGVTALGDRTRNNAEEHIILGELILNNEADKAVDYMTHHLENILSTVLHLMQIF